MGQSFGNVLVELKNATVNKGVIRDATKNILGENAVVRHLEPMVTIEIRNIDDLKNVEKMEEAIKKLSWSILETSKCLGHRRTAENSKWSLFSLRSDFFRIIEEPVY